MSIGQRYAVYKDDCRMNGETPLGFREWMVSRGLNRKTTA